MPYVKSYDPIFDEVFQIEVPPEMVEKIPPEELSETPWPNHPIKSRYRSERHPGWNLRGQGLTSN